MPRYSDDPVRHVVTFRVNSEEKKFLQEFARQTGQTTSDILRRNLQLIKKNDSLAR